MNDTDLILFDLDDTLVARHTTDLLPGVYEWWERNGRSTRCAIVTNQGGVGTRYTMEQEGWGEPEKFPTVEAVTKRLREIEDKLPWGVGDVAVYVCFAHQFKNGRWSLMPDPRSPAWNPFYRKPNPGMLLRAMREAGASPERTLMVGDREPDAMAAKLAGCRFVYASKFFKPKRDAVAAVCDMVRRWHE